MDVSIMSSMGAYYAYQFGSYLENYPARSGPMKLKKAAPTRYWKSADQFYMNLLSVKRAGRKV